MPWSLSLLPEPAVGIYPPSVDACDEAPDGAGRDARKVRHVPEPSCHRFRGTVVHEETLHEVPERRVVYDAHALILCIFSPGVCLVARLLRIVGTPHRIAAEFGRNRIRTPPQKRRNPPRAVSFRAIPPDFFTVYALQVPP